MTKRKAKKLAKECVRFYLEEHVQIIPQNPKNMYAFDIYKDRKLHYFIVGCRSVMDRFYVALCTDNRFDIIEYKMGYDSVKDNAIDIDEFKEWKNDKKRSEIYRQKIW